MSQDYSQASQVYEQLTYLYPEVDEYKLYYSQSLYKIADYDGALRVCSAI
jgi:tetratricopeptide repeat protein 30